MNYTIKQAAEKTGLSISTLRYYDKEGLFPHIQRRDSNYRIFTDSELEAVRIINCFKKAGVEIRDIKHYMELSALGDSTLAERREMMMHQKELLEAKKREIEESLAVADRKIAYYDQAIADGTEAYAKEKYMKERTGEYAADR